ncbi:MAG: hypothetical protein ACQEWV_31145 [Bacillota bacterium]
MMLCVVHVIVVASQNAIRSVLKMLPDASYDIGATKWQTIR